MEIAAIRATLLGAKACIVNIVLNGIVCLVIFLFCLVSAIIGDCGRLFFTGFSAADQPESETPLLPALTSQVGSHNITFQASEL